MEAMAVIMPTDFCENCEAVGRAIGDAYSPVITLDQADNSGAFQMRPRLADMDDMLTSVIDHFKWRTFIILYEGKTGKHTSVIDQRIPIHYNFSTVMYLFIFVQNVLFSRGDSLLHGL